MVAVEVEKRCDLVIDLPRYSWSTLGRVLMRACREGSTSSCSGGGSGGGGWSIRSTTTKTTTTTTTAAAGGTGSSSNNQGTTKITTTNTTTTDCSDLLPFGSPAIHISISPVLTLPPTALWTVCEFLGYDEDDRRLPTHPKLKMITEEGGKDDVPPTTAPTIPPSRLLNDGRDIERLETTCRSLSVEIIHARACMEEERNMRMKQMEMEMMKMMERTKEEEEMGKRKDGGLKGVGGGGVSSGRTTTTTTAVGGDDGAEAGVGTNHPAAAAAATSNIHSTTALTGTDRTTTTTTTTNTGRDSTTPSPIPPSTSNNNTSRPPSSRSSSRVRSQLMTSSKHAERNARRKSVEYCLVSVVLSCSIDHPLYTSSLVLMNNNDNHDEDGGSGGSASGGSNANDSSSLSKLWEKLAPLQDCAARTRLILNDNNDDDLQRKRMEEKEDGKELSTTTHHGGGYGIKERLEKRIPYATALAGKSSLNTFIQKWSSGGNDEGGRRLMNSGSLDVLQRFLNHVALYVDEVYSSEQGGVVLTSCISECTLVYM